MLKFGICFLVVFGLWSCNNEGTTAGQKLDTLINRADSSAERLEDSARAKTKAIKDEIRNRFDKDTIIIIKDTSGRR